MTFTRPAILGAFVCASALGLAACGGSSTQSATTTTSIPAATTTPASTTSTTAAASSTVPTLPPSTTAPATSAPTTVAPTTVPASTTVPPSTVPPTTAVPSCTTGELAVSIGNGNGAAGSTYVTLTFTNEGSSPCTLYGYPGVSYVTGSTGTQVGSPAARDANVNGQVPQVVVTLVPGGVGHAVLQEVDVENYPPATCGPTPVLGLRIYPPGQTAAAFVSQSTTGCSISGPLQLQIGFITP